MLMMILTLVLIKMIKKKDSYTLTKPHKPPAEKMSGKEQESSTTRLLQTACQPLASRKIHCE